jgi:hypothetical protein
LIVAALSSKVAPGGYFAMNFLLYFSTPAQLLFVLVVFGGGSITGLYLVRKWVPLDRLRQNHEIASVTFGVLGAFYGLVLAFVIVAAWQQFNDANLEVHDEASALESLYKLGAAFSEPMRSQIDGAVRSYTQRVIDKEWPAMADDRKLETQTGAHELWQIILTYSASNAKEQMLVDKSIDQLNIISRTRSMRFLYSEADLPSVVWIVIYMGCAITIGFSYFFGSSVIRSQLFMCGILSILIGMTIVAILELAHPYQGTVVISDEPFRYALTRMHDLGNYKFAMLINP